MKTVIFLHHPILNDTFAYFPLEKWDRMGNRKSFDLYEEWGACAPAYAEECENAQRWQAQLLINKLSSEGLPIERLNILLKNDLIKSK